MDMDIDIDIEMDIDLYICINREDFLSHVIYIGFTYVKISGEIYIYITIKIPPRLQCAILRSLQQGLRGLLT